MSIWMRYIYFTTSVTTRDYHVEWVHVLIKENTQSIFNVNKKKLQKKAHYTLLLLTQSASDWTIFIYMHVAEKYNKMGILWECFSVLIRTFLLKEKNVFPSLIAKLSSCTCIKI
jgi:hypothetical protein